jgi:hypothetical protein
MGNAGLITGRIEGRQKKVRSRPEEGQKKTGRRSEEGQKKMVQRHIFRQMQKESLENAGF